MAFYGDLKHNEDMEYEVTEDVKFAVDIPQLGKDEWINVDFFETKEQAINFAKEKFGADDNGMVSLINKV